MAAIAKTLTELLDPLCAWLYLKGQDRQLTRDRPMEVLCLGMSRSGTDSLKQALEILGYNKSYHGWDEVENPKEIWRKFVQVKYEGKGTATKEDWEGLLGGSMAISDMIAAAFAEELMQTYPKAKVILNTRPVDKWFVSYWENIGRLCDNPSLLLLYCFNRELWVMKAGYTRMHQYLFRGKYQAIGKRVYREHSAMVRGMAMKQERELLEYDIAEGWEPLCKFLGKPIPNVPIPNANATGEFAKRFDATLYARIQCAIRNQRIILATIVAFTAATGWAIWKTDWSSMLMFIQHRMAHSALL